MEVSFEPHEPQLPIASGSVGDYMLSATGRRAGPTTRAGLHRILRALPSNVRLKGTVRGAKGRLKGAP